VVVEDWSASDVARLGSWVLDNLVQLWIPARVLQRGTENRINLRNRDGDQREYTITLCWHAHVPVTQWHHWQVQPKQCAVASHRLQ
jgi:hypothetical protein